MTKYIIQYGKYKLETEYSYLPAGLAKEVSRCLGEKEPFGLRCDQSIYIFSSTDNVAIFVHEDMAYTLQVFTSDEFFAFFISTCLYTHTDLLDYKDVGIILNRLKIINNDDNRPRLILPDAS